MDPLRSVGVVIAAAGLGTRLGGLVPKQYCKILDKPLMFYALEEFLNITWVKRIVLVVDNPEKVRLLMQECGYSDLDKVVLINGQESRHRSIKAGLLELYKQLAEDVQVVVVHDGVRPLVSTELLYELAQAASQHGAAGAVKPLVSTVLCSTSDSFLDHSLDRSIHVASETPQAFQLDILLKAYNKCSEEDLDHGTECLHLVLKYCGVKAKLVEGTEDLWKVTHRKDLLLANATLNKKCKSVCIICAQTTPLISSLVESISNVAATVRHIISTADNRDQEGCESRTFSSVIVFHEQEIQGDTHLVDFTTLLDTEKLGLIIHVIENASVEGLQDMSVYSLQRSGRSMAHRYEKLRKGVVIVHCVTGDENTQLVNLLTTLMQGDPHTFSGQTLFV